MARHINFLPIDTYLDINLSRKNLPTLAQRPAIRPTGTLQLDVFLSLRKK